MLGALEFRVSESTYPDQWLGVILFLVSTVSMLLGFAAVRLTDYRIGTSKPSVDYSIDMKRLRWINVLVGIAILSIAIFNCLSAGPPPLLGLFGVDTSSYSEYGRFKQVLFPLAMALAFNSLLDESRIRAWFGSLFALGTLLAYVARGPIILVMAQALILYSIRTSASKRKVYVGGGCVLAFVFVAMSILGEARTAREGFLAYLDIKADFRSWPIPVLWPISYFSIPISNMCWIVRDLHFHAPTLSFLYPILPSFLAPGNPHEAVLSDPHIIDGVHTYMASYFLDFSWGGLVACNLLIGLLGGFLVNRERISRKFLLSPALLTALGFIFFWDFFVYLPTIVELCIQGVVQKLCILPSGGAMSSTIPQDSRQRRTSLRG